MFNNKKMLSHHKNHFSSEEMIIPLDSKNLVYKKHCIIIDSRDRDTNLYPNPNKYVVHFNGAGSGASILDNYKNIVEAHVMECILPNSILNSVPYLILSIPELQNTLSGTNDNLNKASTILVPDKIAGSYCHIRPDINHMLKKRMEPPMNSLHKITLEFLKPNGELYDFLGQADINDENIQHTLVLEITTLNPSMVR